MRVKDGKELKKLSLQIKMEVVKMINSLGSGHVGGSLSITDVLAVLYGKQMKYDAKNPNWEQRDWLVCSKGHAGPALYAVLALKGFFPMELLETLNRPGTNLPSHCDRTKTVGVDVTTGSLGQGASSAAGVALGHKMKDLDNWIYLILGDGESNEGQVWEMALFAAHNSLDNMIAFLDYNKLQLDGHTKDVLDLGDVAAKFREFGWNASSIDGHDVSEIDDAIHKAKQQKNGKPSIIVLNTIKGAGWSEIENQASSHSRGISDEDLEQALAEMQSAMDKL